MNRVAYRAAVSAIASGLIACGIVAGIDDYSIGPCKGGLCTEDASFDGASTNDVRPIVPEDSGKPCPGKALPEGVRVGSTNNTFCIDTYEVTNGEYQEFLAAKIPIESQPELCAWNTTFAPDPSEAGASIPVVGIDWCDALAYCTWAGKYLCGRIENGRKVGAVTVETASDYRSHQWLNACSADATRSYPYGGVFDPAKCNLNTFDAGRPIEGGVAQGCEGGYAGVFDLIGNVWEWYDGPCDGGIPRDGGDGGHQQDNCWIKGASYADQGPVNDCRRDVSGIPRDHHGANVGFRCCSD